MDVEKLVLEYEKLKHDGLEKNRKSQFEKLMEEYNLYKHVIITPDYENVDVILYSYRVPWFATAMTDGRKIWFGPRDFYDPHPNLRLGHELGHWDETTPYTSEDSVEQRGKIGLPFLARRNIRYVI